MHGTTELLMPKLGLTMTEGRVARWAIEPGGRFAVGDVVVEIETDKIVNEVEAPSGGVLVQHVVLEGETAPVGTAIGRWRLETGTASAAYEAPPPTKAEAPTIKQPTAPLSATVGRTVATPYARKLASQAGLDVTTVRGLGPGGRIKAADVQQAIRRSEAAQLPMRAGVDTAPVWATPVPRSPVAARSLSLMTCDVDVSRLEDVEARVALAGSPLRPDRRHYVGLACLRAMTAEVGAGDFRLGFESDAGAGRCVVLTVSSGASLSTLTALHADALAAAESHAANGEAPTGQILIFAGNAASHVFAPSVPAGWIMSVGIGSARGTCRAHAGGIPRPVREMTLALSYDAGALPHARALNFIGTLEANLEEPLGMLVA